MTKITIDRAVVEQALAALATVRCDALYEQDCNVCNAEEALKAALAEPVREPVAYAVGRTLHWHEGKGVNDAQLYLAAPPQRKTLAEPEYPLGQASTDVGVPVYVVKKAEPVQEPFGYLWPTGMHPEFRFTQQKRDGVGMPLYTAPPQRKPLSEEEIAAVTDEHWPDFVAFARAVETAHGIKEGT